MADSTVQQAGGDFTTLNAALADVGTVAGDTITIQGFWTIDDTALATVNDDNITAQIVAGDPSYHNGVYDESNEHYRLATVAAGHSLTINNTGCIIDGLAIVQGGSGASDECIREESLGGTTIIKRCIIQCLTITSDQDGIYCRRAATINIENCILYQFGRAAIHAQGLAAVTQTWNINSLSIYDCTTFTAGAEDDGGGIGVFNDDNVAFICNVNVFNTYVQQGNVDGASADYNEIGSNGTVNWGISYSIDSDNSIASRDASGVGNLANRTIRDVPAGGDEVLVIDIDDPTRNLHLINNAANNDAQDTNSPTSAEGLTLPILDIDDQIRDRANGKIDRGADAFPPIMEPVYGQLIFRSTGPEYGQPLSETGDTFPQYGQIIVVDPKPRYGQEFLKEAGDDQYGQRIVRD